MSDRWMAEISYNNGAAPTVVCFEELEELHNIVEAGPDWNTIEHIVVTLNRPTIFCEASGDARRPINLD